MGGIGPYLDLACRSGMVRSIERHVKAQGNRVDGCGEYFSAGDAEPGGRDCVEM